MRISRTTPALAAALSSLAVLAPAAGAAPDRAVTVSPDAAKATWTGVPAPALNVSFLPPAGPVKGTCTKDPQYYCDLTLVHVTAADISDGNVTFRIDGFQPYSDFDLRVYASDADGNPDTYLGSPASDNAATSPLGANDPRNTAAGDYESKAVPLGGDIDAQNAVDEYFLVEVPYFMVANDQYTGHATLTTTPLQ